MAVRAGKVLGWVAIGLFLVVTTIGIWLPPIVIHATEKAYHFPEVRIEATVRPNGDLLLEERRTFDFRNGPFTYAYFDVDDPYERVRDFTMSEALPGGREVPVEPTYTIHSASTDAFEAMWSYEANDEERTWVFRYRFACAVEVYADTAHLYWRFVGTGWAVPTDHVLVTVHLPGRASGSVDRERRCRPDEPSADVPTTAPLVAGEVRAWGHGPLNGNVTIDDPQTIVLEARDVPPASYVEGSILFPVDAVPVAASSDEPALERILADEATWAGEANTLRARHEAERRWVWWLMVLGPLATAVLVAVARFRDRVPGVPGMLEEPPEGDAVEAAFLWSAWQGAMSPRGAYRAQLLRLARLGAIELRAEGTVSDPDDVTLVRRMDADDLPTATDRDFHAMLFGTGDDTLAEVSLRKPPRARAGSAGRYRSWLEDARRGPADTLTAIRKGDARFEAVGVMVVAGVGAGYGVWTATWGLGGSLGWWLLPVALLSLVWGLRTIPARVELEIRTRIARLAAFRRYLADFSDLPNAPVLAIVIWETYLEWAAALGVADRVEGQVVALVPAEQLPPAIRGGPSGLAGVRVVHDLDAAATTLVLARSIVPSSGSTSGGFGSSSSSSGFSGGGFSGGGGGGGGGTGGRAG